MFQQKEQVQRPWGWKGHGKYMLLKGSQCLRTTKATLKKRHTLEAKTFYKAIVIKQCGIGTRINKLTNETRGQNLETDPHMYNYHVYDKGNTVVQWERDGLFNI